MGNIADGLDCHAVKETLNVISEGNPKFALELYKQKLSDSNAAALNKVSSAIECQVFGDFINTTSIKSAIALMNYQRGDKLLLKCTHFGG